MQIGVIGINHKQADVSLRETIANAILRQFAIGATLENAVLLLTCNRAELYFSGPNLAELHQRILAALRDVIQIEFEQKCYSFFGRDCFLHLAQVTSGLDSAIVAETEIQGQVKQAYESAATLRPLSSELHFLFQKCLKIGKAVRTSYFINERHLPAIEHTILSSAEQYFGKALPQPLFLGASEINIKMARFLAKHGVSSMHFCNRTNEKAERLAEEFHGTALPWSDLQAKWDEYEWIIAGAKSPSSLLLPKRTQSAKRLLIDLAVPRNIHPEVAGHVLNIDDLNSLLQAHKKALTNSIQQAHALITTTLMRYSHRFQYSHSA